MSGWRLFHGVTTSTGIRELPRSDRPRERLVDLGVQALSTAELLALLLGPGTKNRSAVQLGQAVFMAFGGSLRRIARDPVASLTAIPGVGLARVLTPAACPLEFAHGAHHHRG